MESFQISWCTIAPSHGVMVQTLSTEVLTRLLTHLRERCLRFTAKSSRNLARNMYSRLEREEAFKRRPDHTASLARRPSGGPRRACIQGICRQAGRHSSETCTFGHGGMVQYYMIEYKFCFPTPHQVLLELWASAVLCPAHEANLT